ncbi:MAG: hypothetical protein QM791_05515 [Ferruginibacter sp.]
MKTLQTTFIGLLSLIAVHAAAQTNPVKYNSFTALADKNKIDLNWAVSNETGDVYYEVERSFDGKNFTTAGLVLDGINEGSGTKTYRMRDNTIAVKNRPVIYYRVKQKGANAAEGYSEVIEINSK